MEPQKRGNSDCISSPESNDHDHQPEKSTDDSAGVGRSYECNFCKRGFTNAQALGGHMNIHRKDKAKAAKQKNMNNRGESSINNIRDNINIIKPHENYYGSLRYLSQINPSTHDHQQQQQQYYRAVGGYQVFLPSPNPSFQTGYDYNLPVWRPDTDPVDADLSLSIGQPPAVDRDRDGEDNNVLKENEVDLELRLGHDP